ncbi:MAG: Na/Pi cotransporter family protein, partial [Lachnospiraceae bacterium]|nr:Na/Pi cotransporter family protein [Lachnospiraceae bacterium]
TVIIQSSSASVGILQALSATGSVTYGIAVPIIIGQNIGKCATILLGGVGTGKKAKRLSLSYLLFNLFGAVFFLVLYFVLRYAAGLPIFAQTVSRGNIADIHLCFNLLTSILLLPFSEQMAKLSGTIVGRDASDAVDQEFARLDDLVLKTPTVALSQCKRLMAQMRTKVEENYAIATEMLRQYSSENFDRLEENESFIDRCETALSAYLIKIDKKRLPEKDAAEVNELIGCISDFERIGDYSISMAYTAREMQEAGVSFTEDGKRELGIITDVTREAIETLRIAFDTGNAALARQIEPLGDVEEKIRERIRKNHMERLTAGTCSIQAGIALNDLLNAFDRICGHSANIALHIIGQSDKPEDFDEMHGHMAEPGSEEYRKAVERYEEQFLLNSGL